TLGITPRIAMLSFSNFGSVRHPEAEKVARAVQLLRQRDPSMVVDGEMQADTALDEDLLKSAYPFSWLSERANVLIFPNLSAGNIAYKLLHHLGGATAIGPILVGMNRPVHVLERGADVQDIVNKAAVAVMDAQERTTGRASQQSRTAIKLGVHDSAAIETKPERIAPVRESTIGLKKQGIDPSGTVHWNLIAPELMLAA